MKQDEASNRQKIMEATIDCIERDGLHTLTIRNIAKEAGVNSAAINYYFGSKEILIESALNATLKEGFPNMIEEILNVEKKPLKAFYNLLTAQMEGAVKFPGLTRAHFQAPFLIGHYSDAIKETFREFLAAVYEKLKPVMDTEEKRMLKLSIIQSLSCIYFAALFPDLFKEFSGIDFQDPKSRKKYIRHLMKSYFGDQF